MKAEFAAIAFRKAISANRASPCVSIFSACTPAVDVLLQAAEHSQNDATRAVFPKAATGIVV
jgi:hypothetical protein